MKYSRAETTVNTCNKRGVLSRCRHNGWLQFSISQTRVNFKKNGRQSGKCQSVSPSEDSRSHVLHGTNDLGTWYVESNDRYMYAS